ncbi:MAG: hypothetical protein ACOWWM_06135 [Desulfobacterales bacterium]
MALHLHFHLDAGGKLPAGAHEAPLPAVSIFNGVVVANVVPVAPVLERIDDGGLRTELPWLIRNMVM